MRFGPHALSILSTVAGLVLLALPAASLPRYLQNLRPLKVAYCESLFTRSTTSFSPVHGDPQAFKAFSIFIEKEGLKNPDEYERFIVPKYINTYGSRQASLTAPFAASFVELRPVWESTFNHREPTIRSGTYWDYRKQPWFQIFVWRGAIDEPSFPKTLTTASNVPGKPTGLPISSINVRNTIQASLSKLYEDFGNQGPERKILVPIVQEQDRNDVERVTHFEIGHFSGEKSEGAGHLQVMISRNSSEPLHFEDQWGEVKRAPGEVIAEAGRYYFSYADEKIDKRALTKDQKALSRLLIWQKMFAWANHDVRIDRMFFQVNDRVRDVLEKKYGLPLDKAKSRLVTQVIDGKEVSEWVFELSHDVMLLCEERLMARLLITHIEAYLKDTAPKRIYDRSQIRMRFTRNELYALSRFGLIPPDQTAAQTMIGVEVSMTTKQAQLFLPHLYETLK